MIIQLFHSPVFIVMLFLCMIGLISICLNYKHLLSMLLRLEIIMMGLFCLSVVSLSYLGTEAYCSLIILTFSACEASVGLSVLVNLISSHGRSIVSSLNLSQC